MSDRSALVTYGSETGNACEYAQELGQLVQRLRFSTDIVPLDSVVDAKELSKYTLFLVVISTTGQGDVPLNAKRFWKSLLRKKLPPDHLEATTFAVFGLGDSSYPKFNWAVRKLHKRLAQLGATELYARGEADEQHPDGTDAAFVSWVDGLRETILRECSLTDIDPIPQDQYLPPKYQLTAIDAQHVQVNGQSKERFPSTDRSNSEATPLYHAVEPDIERSTINSESLNSEFFYVTLRENRRLTPSTHWQDVRHLTLVADGTVPYDPGDVLTIFPENLETDVNSLIHLMQWTNVADKPLQYVATDIDGAGVLAPSAIGEKPSSGPMTLRNLLTHQMDITAVPRRSFFSAIAHFAQDQTQKERILDFIHPEYVDWLHDYTTRPRRSILEVLHELDSVKIPWKWAPSIFPTLRGRQFSIASGGNLKTCRLTGQSQFELLVAVVKYQTIIRKTRTGVCTSYLARLPLDARLRVQLVKGSLSSAIQQRDIPVVMVGPGTGLAPLRSLIHERCSRKDVHAAGSAELALFFGCRSKDADYFYNEEWKEIRKRLPLEIYTAFSRDQKAKVYVQDLIRSESALIYRLLCEQQGALVVCGSSGSMPKAVRQAVVDAFIKAGNKTAEAAEKCLQSMESQNRYKQETWS